MIEVKTVEDFLAVLKADDEADPLRTIEVTVVETVRETFTVEIDVPVEFDTKDPANQDRLAELVEVARVNCSDSVGRRIAVTDVEWRVKKDGRVESQMEVGRED